MIDKLMGDLAYGDQTNPVEEALRVLGCLLGLNASRPDKEEGTGPDVKEVLSIVVDAGFIRRRSLPLS